MNSAHFRAAGVAGARLHTAGIVIVCGAWLLAAGCADLNYQRIQIGQPPREYDRALPSESTRRTALGLAHVSSDKFGRTDAVVVLLSPDRRVWGKLRVTFVERDYRFKVERGIRLEGEVDPGLGQFGGVGPFDALKSVASDLLNYQGERLALEAHGWIAAGMVRLLERWPHVGIDDLETVRISEWLDRIPGGGVARIEVDAAGKLRFSYEQGAAPK